MSSEATMSPTLTLAATDEKYWKTSEHGETFGPTSLIPLVLLWPLIAWLTPDTVVQQQSLAKEIQEPD